MTSSLLRLQLAVTHTKCNTIFRPLPNPCLPPPRIISHRHDPYMFSAGMDVYGTWTSSKNVRRRPSQAGGFESGPQPPKHGGSHPTIIPLLSHQTTMDVAVTGVASSSPSPDSSRRQQAKPDTSRQKQRQQTEAATYGHKVHLRRNPASH